MKSLILLLTLSVTCLADKPSPQYVAPKAAEARQDTYGSPEAPPEAAPQVAPTPDTYGAPKAPVVDSYGSPQAPVVKEDAYGAPSAPVISQPAEAAPVGNQGYYYYYYPVKQGGQSYEAEEQEGDGGLLGGLLSDGLLGTLVTKKILLVVLGIGAFLLVTALGIQVNFGRSFSSTAWDYASPYMTEDNLITLADFVSNSIAKYK